MSIRQGSNVLAGLQDISGKADTDLSNVTATGKETTIGWGMPDYGSGISSTTPYSAPSKGWVMANISAHNANSSLFVDGVIVSSGGGSNSCNDNRLIPVDKGQQITTANAFLSNSIVFFQCKGI